MKIKANLSFFALFFIVLAGSLSSNVFAQNHKKLKLENLFVFVPDKGKAAFAEVSAEFIDQYLKDSAAYQQIKDRGEIRFYSVMNRKTGEFLTRDSFDLLSMSTDKTFDGMFLAREIDLEFRQLRSPDPRDEIQGRLLFDTEAESLSYRPPSREGRKVSAKEDPKDEHRLAAGLLRMKAVDLMLGGDKVGGIYDVYSLDFNKGVSLEPIVKDEKDAIEISYALDIVELQNKDFQLLRLAEWNEYLKERDRSVNKEGSFLADRKLLEKESPALAESIEEITNALREAFYTDKAFFNGKLFRADSGVNPSDIEINGRIEIFKEMLYRISVNVDAYELKSLSGWYRTRDGTRENRYSVPAIDDLVWLFYLQLEQMAVAKKEKNKEQTIALAKNALGTVSEIYLLAGKTKGSALNQISIQSLISLSLMASSFLIGLSDVLPNNLRIAPFLIGGGFMLHTLFQAVRLKKGEFSFYPERFSARYLFPGVSFWERKLKSRKIRSVVLAESLELRKFLLNRKVKDRRAYFLSPYVVNSFNNPQKMLRMIELASEQPISTIVFDEAPSDCAALFSWFNFK